VTIVQSGVASIFVDREAELLVEIKRGVRLLTDPGMDGSRAKCLEKC
jgi:hypothetical protein